jgi:hypothetical protein
MYIRLIFVILTLFPFNRHIFSDDETADEHDGHRYHREKSKHRVHTVHLHDRKHTEQKRVKKHHYTHAEAILNRLEIVREKRHKVADLVVLIIILTKLAATVEHSVSKIGLDPYTASEKAYSPQKSAEDHCQNNEQKRSANFVKQKIHIEGLLYAVDDNKALVNAVDNRAVNLGYDKLHIIDKHERKHTEQKQR